MAEEPNVHPVVHPHPVVEVHQKDVDVCEQLRVVRLSPEEHEQEEPELDYVVELYGFQPVLKTKDLIAELRDHFRPDEFRLKWVDDTHALSIFTSSVLAHQASRTTFPHLNARMLALASDQSKAVARKVAEDMRPVNSIEDVQSRPKTTAMVARRFVCNALGVRVVLSKEQREKEQRELLEAKGQREKGRREKEREDSEGKELMEGSMSKGQERKDNEGEDSEGKELMEGSMCKGQERKDKEGEDSERKELMKAEAVVSTSREIMEPKAASKEVVEVKSLAIAAIAGEPKARPRALVAHRLVCNALGVSKGARRKELVEVKDDKRHQ